MTSLVKTKDRLRMLARHNAIRFSGPGGCWKLRSGTGRYRGRSHGHMSKSAIPFPRGFTLPLGLFNVFDVMAGKAREVMARPTMLSRRALRATKEK